MRKLTPGALRKEAAAFARSESGRDEPILYGATDGKTIGAYFERKFKDHLSGKYEFEPGNPARGVDFPGIDVEMKITRITQPQSSCPFKSARQKIFGLGYSLLVFVYEKSDDHAARTGRLEIRHTIYVDRECTADFQTTRGILQILDNDGNKDDLVAFFSDRHLPVDEIGAANLAEEVLRNRPAQGYLTVSAALQWRLQYGRVIGEAGSVRGIYRVT